ncbi:hypothetical protein VPHD69_0132 [Vibrio phage D69]
MDYNHNWSLANIHNVVVALNEGGIVTCDDIMERVWYAASTAKRQEKIDKPSNPARRNADYARQQLRQEVRRSLYSHFNDPDRHGFDIFRATPYGDAEHFWVAEEQVASVGNDVDFVRTSGTLVVTDESVLVEMPVEPAADEPVFTPFLSPNAPLIERLQAANNTGFSSSQLLRDAVENEVTTGVFSNPHMPDEFAEALTDTLGPEFVGEEINSTTMSRFADRVNGILTDLEAYYE